MSRIMAHTVPFYPDLERSRAAARGLLRGGAALIEVQFPFSDPTADGPVIEEACHRALGAGFTVDAGFAFVREVCAQAADRPVFIMSYANLVFARGVRRFLEDGKAAGAAGFIVPDLPVDCDEGVYGEAERLGTRVVPVLVTSSRESRIHAVLDRSPEYLYVALRRGTTGARTELEAGAVAVLDRLTRSGARVLAGFGIAERTQVVALEAHVHAVVVGSELVRTVGANAAAPPAVLEEAVAARVRALAG